MKNDTHLENNDWCKMLLEKKIKELHENLLMK